MLTRRELLLSVGAIGLPLSVAAHGATRLGALQSRAPFMDENDLCGARARAFAAYRVLLRRSVEQHGPFDWLAGGAFPLSGPGPFRALERVALTKHSEEVRWLSSFARTHRLQLTLGAWWLEPGHEVAARLLIFDRDGGYRARPLYSTGAITGLHFQLPDRHEKPQGDLAAMCQQRRSYGVRIEMLAGPPAPPGAGPSISAGSFIVGPDGIVLAKADVHTEACLVATV